MRAIIIDNKDALALLDQLKLEKLAMENWPPDCGAGSIQDVHSAFRLVVVRWLQEQGASCVR